MIYPIFSIKDAKVAFGLPQVDSNEVSAIRNFSMAINASSGLMAFSPKDFDLYKIGEFNTESGEIKGCIPEFVCSGTSVFGEKDKS